jgi:hypothetical protein
MQKVNAPATSATDCFCEQPLVINAINDLFHQETGCSRNGGVKRSMSDRFSRAVADENGNSRAKRSNSTPDFIKQCSMNSTTSNSSNGNLLEEEESNYLPTTSMMAILTAMKYILMEDEWRCSSSNHSSEHLMRSLFGKHMHTIRSLANHSKCSIIRNISTEVVDKMMMEESSSSDKTITSSISRKSTISTSHSKTSSTHNSNSNGMNSLSTSIDGALLISPTATQELFFIPPPALATLNGSFE